MSGAVSKSLDQRSGEERRKDGGPNPNKVGVEILKAVLIALAVLFAENLANKPAETQATLSAQATRITVLETKMDSIKQDLQDIKQAVGARNR